MEDGFEQERDQVAHKVDAGWTSLEMDKEGRLSSF